MISDDITLQTYFTKHVELSRHQEEVTYVAPRIIANQNKMNKFGVLLQYIYVLHDFFPSLSFSFLPSVKHCLVFEQCYTNTFDLINLVHCVSQRGTQD